MSIQVLANHEDTMATIYQSSSDWSLGPVFYTHGENMSAEKLAEKFIEWAGLRHRGIFEDWSDAWMEAKRNEFSALDWIRCPECWGDEIVPRFNLRHPERGVGICKKCLETCDECGERNEATEPTSRWPYKATARLCPECAKHYEKQEASHG